MHIGGGIIFFDFFKSLCHHLYIYTFYFYILSKKRGHAMFDPKLSNSRKSVTACYFLSNWEEDISDVEVESCDSSYDPSGFRVKYYKQAPLVSSAGRIYYVGASHLGKRLECLRKAGYDAPMTSKAMRLIEQCS